MKCLKCGYCCIAYSVVIVSNPKKGISEDNMEFHKGDKPCKHLKGDTPGKYSCKLHDYPWYDQTPCFDYGQIEDSKDTPCRTGVYLMNKLNRV